MPRWVSAALLAVQVLAALGRPASWLPCPLAPPSRPAEATVSGECHGATGLVGPEPAWLTLGSPRRRPFLFAGVVSCHYS